MSVSGELERLAALHRDGAIDDIEFAAAKREVLGLTAGPDSSDRSGSTPSQSPGGGPPAPPPLAPPHRSAATGTPTTRAPSVPPASVGGFGTLGKTVTFGLYLFALGGAVLLITAFDAQANFADWDRLRSGTSAAAMWDADARLLNVLETLSIAMLFFVVLFIVWLWNLHKRVSELLNVQLELGRGWTIGAWFVPVAFLWMPWRVVDDLHEHLGRPRAPIKVWWWSLVATVIALRALGPLTDSEAWNAFYSTGVLAGALMVTAAVAGARMVEALADALTDAYEQPETVAAEAAFLRAMHDEIPTSRTATRNTLLGMGYEMLAADYDDRLPALVDELAEGDAVEREKLRVIAKLARRHLQLPTTAS